MMDLLVILITTLVFVILVVIIFRTIKDALGFDVTGGMVLSVCVSALATIGLSRDIKGILIPYAALGVVVLFILGLFFRKHIYGNKHFEDRYSDESIDKLRKSKSRQNDECKFRP